MNNKFRIILRTPEAELVNCEVESVYLTTETGDMMLLPGHAAFSASITYSPVVIKYDGTEEEYLVYNGLIFFSNNNNELHILVQRADLKERIDYEGLKTYLKLVQDYIENGKDLSEIHMRYLENERVALVQGIEAKQ